MVNHYIEAVSVTYQIQTTNPGGSKQVETYQHDIPANNGTYTVKITGDSGDGCYAAEYSPNKSSQKLVVTSATTKDGKYKFVGSPSHSVCHIEGQQFPQATGYLDFLTIPGHSNLTCTHTQDA